MNLLVPLTHTAFARTVNRTTVLFAKNTCTPATLRPIRLHLTRRIQAQLQKTMPILFLLVFPFFGRASLEPIRAGCEPDYPPFCTITADGQANGFSVELLRTAMRSMGRDILFSTNTWAELRLALEHAQLQVLPLMDRTPAREHLYDFTFPYLTLHGTIIVRSDTDGIRTPNDLIGKQVAVLQGDSAEEYLRTFVPGAIRVPLPSFNRALHELSEGLHDAVVIQKLLAIQLIQKSNIRNLVMAGPPLQDFKQQFCFGVRKGDKDLLATLNEGLSIAIADGTFKTLYSQWLAPIELQAQPKRRIIVGGDANYPPFEFLDNNNQPTGFNVDLTRAIAKQMGFPVDIRLGTWNRIRHDLKTGAIDVIQGMFYSIDRDQVFDFTPPSELAQQVIVSRRGVPQPPDLRSLSGNTLVVERGDIMDDFVSSIRSSNQIVRAASGEEALHQLVSGQHDYALIARLPALFWARKNNWKTLNFSASPITSSEYCYAVPNGNDEILSLFTEGLAAVKASGEYRRIQAKWLAPYEPASVGFSTILLYVLAFAAPLLALLGIAVLWSHSLGRQVNIRTRELVLKNAILAAQNNASLDGILAVAIPKGNILSYNVQLRRIWDIPIELPPDKYLSAIGQHLRNEDAFVQLVDQLARSPAESMRDTLMLKDGRIIEAYTSPITDIQTTLRGRIWFFRDVTNIHQANEALRAAADKKQHLLDNAKRVRQMLLTVIEQQRLTEDRLLKSEVRFRSLYESMREGVAIHELVYDKLGQAEDYILLNVNPAFEKILGLKASAVIGRKATEVYNTEAAPFLDVYAQVVKTGIATHFEATHESMSRTFSISVVSPAKGHFATIFEDITSRKESELALRESEARLHALGDNIPGGMLYQIITPRTGKSMFTYVSAGVERIFGLSPESVIKDPKLIWSRIAEEDRSLVESARTKSLHNLSVLECEFRKHVRSGTCRWFLARSTPRRLEDGSIISDGVLVDITERKQTENALRESEERFRSLIESAPDAVFVQSDGRFRYLNRAALELFGATRAEQLIDTPLMDRIAPEYRDIVRDRIRIQLETGKSVPLVEQDDIRLDGSRVPVETTAMPILFQGRPSHLVFLRDVTARRQAQAERERLLAAIDQSSETIVITDTTGTILYANPAFERISGYSRAEALGKNPRLLKSGKHEEPFYREMWSTILRGETWRGRFVNACKDGSLYTEEASISPVRDAAGNIVNFVAVKRDITEHLRLSAQLAQAQKLESIGRLAGGVAHDFNNMLSVILGNIELVMGETDHGTPVFADLQEIRKAAERSADLTRQLLAFARQQTVTPQVLDLNDTVSAMLRMLRRLIGEQIELLWHPCPHETIVRIDPSQLDQILANLCVNARDAISGAGRILIETSLATLTDTDLSNNADAQPGTYVALAVHDNGCGMDAETLEHIFEPFFTTKGIGEGTGLGLATVYGIVRQNGGSIAVRSAPQQGTSFTIYLLRHEAKPASTSEHEPLETLSAHHETVLLVEDEPSILELGRRKLEQLGYRVLAAKSPEEAIGLAQLQGDAVDLLVTDVVMPQMSGWELARQLKALHARLKLVFMSGYAADATATTERPFPDALFIQKPFTLKALANTVDAALKGQPPHARS